MFRTFLRNKLSIAGLWGLAVVAVATLVLPHFSFRVEDLQTALFPIVLICFMLLPRDSRLRLPTPLAIAAAGCWVFFTFQVSGSIPGHLAVEKVVLGRLEGDADGLAARGIYQRYYEISRTYELTKMDQVQRSFSSDSEARDWLAVHRGTPFLVRGTAAWHRVVFPEDASPIYQNYSSLTNASGLPSKYVQRSESYGVSLDTEGAAFMIPGTTTPFVVTLLPEAVQIPGEPAELARHLIAWLGQALRRGDLLDAGWPEQLLAQMKSPRSLQFTKAFRHAVRQDALIEATRIDGLWQSRIPLGTAHFFSATLSLFEALDGEQPQPALYKAAIEDFRTASSYVDKTGAPEVFAAIFNNAAGALLASADSDQDVAKARTWLGFAAETPAVAGAELPPLGARAAMLNLLMLDRAEIY